MGAREWGWCAHQTFVPGERTTLWRVWALVSLARANSSRLCGVCHIKSASFSFANIRNLFLLWLFSREFANGKNGLQGKYGKQGIEAKGRRI
jgi:hypothetical protein